MSDETVPHPAAPRGRLRRGIRSRLTAHGPGLMAHGSETIVALCTPPGPAARAIVRLSGPGALSIAGRLAGRAVARRRGVTEGRLGRLPASLWIMPGPRSYTGEDVVEIHLPGAEPAAHEAVLRCLEAGARAAGPGEFTQRAFLNGRLDLAQAEAVQAVIASRSEHELQAALNLLRGDFSSRVREIESGLLDLGADVEAAIDFTDQDIEILSAASARARAAGARDHLKRLLAETAARRIRSGPPAAFLYGPPNAGKSSLFNRLTGGRAIVSPVPGTTRDLLSGECEGARLLDAPGVFDAEGVDAEAVRRARAEAEHADLRILVLEGTASGAAGALLEDSAGRACLGVVAKADLLGEEAREELRNKLRGREWILTSALTGEGLDALRDRLSRFARGTGAERAGARFHVSLRQREELEEAVTALERSIEALERGPGMEFIALDLRAALEALGAVTGRQVGDDLLRRLFERFCIGK